MPVDTKTVHKRPLRFNTLSDVIAEADRLAAAEKAGKLKQLGNWSLDQILNHLATWANFPFDGYPPELSNPPWIIKLILKFKKKSFMQGKMPQGVRIPGIKAGTVGMDAIGTENAIKKLRASLTRLDETQPKRPNPIFGPMSHDDWKCINIRHAELHMGFLQPL